MLSKSQLNQLVQILTENNLSPTLFKKSEAELSFKIDLLDSLYHFHIYKGSVELNLSIIPVISNPLPTNDWFRWNDVVRCFSSWAKTIAEDNAAPDLWAEAATTAQLFAAPAAPDEKFTDHELRELQSQLRAAEAKLATSGLPEAAIRELTAALRDAAPKAETMSKKDWQNMVIGAIVGNLTTLALSAEHVQTVYQILKATFTGWLLH